MNRNTRQSATGDSAPVSLPSALVCFAVEQEAAHFRKLAADCAHVSIAVIGMGRRSAERSLKELISYQTPDFVVTAGFAGGLRTGLAAGTVLFAADSVPWMQEALQAAGAVAGKFHCSDRVASTREEKRALRAQTGADAVEMESEVICRLCREARIPSATVRVVLDTADEDLPLDFNALLTPENRVDGWKLAGALLRQPGKVRALMRFQNCCRTAALRLAEVLAKLVGVSP